MIVPLLAKNIFGKENLMTDEKYFLTKEELKAKTNTELWELEQELENDKGDIAVKLDLINRIFKQRNLEKPATIQDLVNMEQAILQKIEKMSLLKEMINK
jgi:hypothetical protein